MFSVPGFLAGTVLRLRGEAVDELACRGRELEEERELFAQIALRNERARIALVNELGELGELGGPTVLALDDVSALASWPLGLGTATTLADPHVRKVCVREGLELPLPGAPWTACECV